MQIYRYTDIWFFCENLKKTKTPIGFGAWRFFTLLSSQNMIPQKSRVSYLEKFKMVQTHREDKNNGSATGPDNPRVC